MISAERQREIEEAAIAGYESLQKALLAAVSRRIAGLGDSPTPMEIAASGAALRRETALIASRTAKERSAAVAGAMEALFRENGEADG